MPSKTIKTVCVIFVAGRRVSVHRSKWITTMHRLDVGLFVGSSVVDVIIGWGGQKHVLTVSWSTYKTRPHIGY